MPITHGFLVMSIVTYLGYTHCSGLEDFFSGVKQNKVDLVILMDRSLTVGRHDFYKNQKPLIYDIIMYHLHVRHESLHIAMATFAVSVDVIVDGISHGNRRVTKCDIFNDQTTALWNEVIYKATYYKDINGRDVEDYSDVKEANVNEALAAADKILMSGRAARPGVEQYVLVATAAGWTSKHNPRSARDQLLDNGVQVYGIGVGAGVESRLNKLRELQTEPNGDKVQLQSVWKQQVFSQPLLIKVMGHADWVAHTDQTCSTRGGQKYCEVITTAADCTIFPINVCETSGCQNGGTCIQGEHAADQCVCPPGKHGRFCEKDVDACSAPGVCYPGSVCRNLEDGYECVCSDCDDLYCDCASPPPPLPDLDTSSDPDDDGRNLTWLYVLIPLLLILIIILLVVAFICYRRKKRTTDRLEAPDPSQRSPGNFYTGRSKPSGGSNGVVASAEQGATGGDTDLSGGEKGSHGVNIYDNSVDYDFDEIRNLEKGKNVYDNIRTEF